MYSSGMIIPLMVRHFSVTSVTYIGQAGSSSPCICKIFFFFHIWTPFIIFGEFLVCGNLATVPFTVWSSLTAALVSAANQPVVC